MKSLLVICILLLSACSSSQPSTQTKAITQAVVSAFVVPAMRLMPVSQQTNLNIIQAHQSGRLSTVYKGKAFPDLNGVEFSGEAFKGFINISKTINGLKLKKQLANTALSISHFATDADGEIYIATTEQQIYKFSP